MSQRILTTTGDILPIQNLRRLTFPEYNNPSMRDRIKDFDKAIKVKLGDSLSVANPPTQEEEKIPPRDPDLYVPYEGHYEGKEESILSETDDVTDPNLLLNAEVKLSNKSMKEQTARVMNRTKDKDSNLIGTYNPDPILNTIVYDVMFPDAPVSEYATNLIGENIYSQIDEEGHRY